MRAFRRLFALLISLLLAACAATHDAATPEARQALAPTGKLRVGLFQGNPVHAVKDATTGDWKGVSHDLGKAFAERLGVPFEPVLYSTVATFLDGGPKGEWDIAFLGVSAERAKTFDYAGRHLDIEFGYLVPAGSPMRSVEEVDRAGVRVAVGARGSPDVFLSKHLKHATLVREDSIPKAVEALKQGKADAYGSTKAILFGVSQQLPGSRVLEGRLGAEEQALALPKGRGAAAAAFARAFVEEAKAAGTVKAAIERSGLRGASVAP